MTTIAVRNPRTGAADYEIEPPTQEELAERCAQLRNKQVHWASVSLEDRLDVLGAWADAIERNAEAISAALEIDTGRRRMEREAPHGVAASIRSWQEIAPKALQFRSGVSRVNPAVSFHSQLKPYPLVGVISPWNFPLALSLIDALPALVAGCAAIIKPSEVTPRFIRPLVETINEVPELAQVLAYVEGAGETGQALIENVDMVCFTGSVATGRKVGEAAARRFIPAFLELGGKDPVVVTASADLDRAVRSVLKGSVYATGQICFSIERIYVHESQYDAFVERLTAAAKEIEINHPSIDSGHIGPIIFERQADLLRSHLEDAVAKGASITTGGEIEDHGGLWLRPTVIRDVDHTMKVMTEETFGPIMPVMSYRSEEDAVALANDTEFGLSAAVIAGDPEEAQRIGEQIDAGAISIMDTILTGNIIHDAEKNSFKFSGLGGSRMGPSSLMRFFRKKALLTQSGEPADMRDLGEVG